MASLPSKQSSERPDSSEPRFSDTFARRPTVPRRGLLPGRRVWATTVAVAAVVGIAALTVPLISHIDLTMETAAADRPVVAAPSRGTPTTPAATPRQTSSGTQPPSQATAQPPAAPNGPRSVAAPPIAAGGQPQSRPRPAPPASVPSKAPAPKPKPSIAPGSAVVGTGSGRCITVPGGTGTDGLALQIGTCNGANSQRWDFQSDGTVRSMGYCMDVAWGSHDDGALIQLARCSGNPAQRFIMSGAGDLVNPQANKCVDVANNATASGSKVQLWTCKGTPNQKWRLR
ncbi:ricin-type beta-trefoil lectin domain protein [Streptomyces sp. H39-C1]|uniref:ricin-type beta-trefoil lectin domain protein n=1 Tax=Streptomyces sp. H39-C1 TaxID=3004355 RepID=UPI0022AEEDB5|nr:ricin-type beta-trefoil lectin domain protein [Streptomyces sp. H39-C1]MCZ4099949.1 ricin-type beta-trefoil lectin domain protein [Streptomyces sp. H39-C1]